MSKNFLKIIFLSAMFSLLPGKIFSQEVKLTLVDWNVRSFEVSNSSGQLLTDDISDYIALLRDSGADVITLNEFENYTGRMGRDRMSEIASALDMFAYYIASYPKDTGYYGNVILSKYPIVNAASHLYPYVNAKGEGYYDHNEGDYLTQYGADQRSIGYVDILVPVSETENTIVRIVCTHMDHEIGSDGHGVQFEEAAEFPSLADPPYPALLAGDLNITQADFMSPITSIGDWIHNGGLDHIFGFPKGVWTVVSHESIKPGNMSDHSAVKAVVTLTR